MNNTTSPQNIRKDYLWNTIGVFAQTAISPLLLVAVTRINGIEDSGIVSFAFATALIFWGIASWGGRTYQVSDTKGYFSPKSYIVVRLLLGVCTLLVAILFCIANSYDTFKSGVIISFVAFKVVESVADAYYGILQVHGRLYTAGKSLLAKAILGFFLFLAIDIYTQDIFLSSLGFITMNLLILLVYDIPKAKIVENISTSPTMIFSYFADAVLIIKHCTPIAAVAVIAMFSLNIPRYFLDIYYVDQVGYFGILVMPITALGLFITFILQPNIVNLSKLFGAKQYEKFNKAVLQLMKITALSGIVLITITYLVGVEILELIFGVSFESYKLTLVMLAVGATFNAYISVYMNIFIIMRHLKEQFYILVLTNILLTVLCIWIVKQYSLTGAIGLFSVINAVQVILLTISYKRLLRRAEYTQSVIE